ncbi:hypothetical protein SAMN05421821_10527 [Mucilaginibacter lappiensis]|uniref:Uncharacterized protein n=1 Tax=Mucilaginibacter lappiensis TaxID=354630 RepID=A0ABR6PIZ9_9SPHI|nr:hypothetical protein [Mucilaginibacter lappiensis]SIR09371.1 hypothetical protein SAMN05421821_10527 [Mucilaginibacter lappiensis]
MLSIKSVNHVNPLFKKFAYIQEGAPTTFNLKEMILFAVD